MRNDSAGIYTAAEERTERHVTDKLHAHGFLKLCADPFDPFFFAVILPLAKGHIPIFADFGAAIFGDEIVTWEQFFDSFNQAERGGHVAEGQVLLKCSEIQSARNISHLENGFHLRCEEQTPGLAADKQGFLSHAVAPQHQPLTFCIPEPKGEHPPEPLNEIEAFFFVEVNDDFRIGARTEAMAFGFHLVPQRLEVINLAIKDYPN